MPLYIEESIFNSILASVDSAINVSWVSEDIGGGGGGGKLPRFWVGMSPSSTKKHSHKAGKIFHSKTPKTYKNDRNLLIFLDLSYNPCTNLIFYSLQAQILHIFFLIFTYKNKNCQNCQGKIVLILPITLGV